MAVKKDTTRIQTSFRIKEETAALLDELARLKGSSRNHIYDEALQLYLDRELPDGEQERLLEKLRQEIAEYQKRKASRTGGMNMQRMGSG